MKMKRVIALTLTAVMAFAAFTACSDANTENSDVVVISSQSQANPANQTLAPEGQEGFTFVYNNVKVRPNTDIRSILNDLGSNYSYFESASCAGLGMSKTYTYNSGSFVISTNPVGEADVISNVTLFDDTVSTAEGISIGSTKEEVVAKYGTPTTDMDTTLTYELNDTMLVIILNDGKVISIVYNAVY